MFPFTRESYDTIDRCLTECLSFEDTVPVVSTRENLYNKSDEKHGTGHSDPIFLFYDTYLHRYGWLQMSFFYFHILALFTSVGLCSLYFMVIGIVK